MINVWSAWWYDYMYVWRDTDPAFLALEVESPVRSAAGTTRSINKCPCVRSTSRGGEPCPSTGESDSSPFGELGGPHSLQWSGAPVFCVAKRKRKTLHRCCSAVFFGFWVSGWIAWDRWRHIHFPPGLNSLPKQCAGAQIGKVRGTTIWDVSTRRLYEDLRTNSSWTKRCKYCN